MDAWLPLGRVAGYILIYGGMALYSLVVLTAVVYIAVEIFDRRR